MSDFFVFAGESSGDHLGSELIKSLNKANPSLKIEGVLGPYMRAQKATCLLKMEEFQVMGFIDVVKSLKKLKRLFKETRDLIEKSNPKALILIDYPGLNLRLAKSLKKRGFKPPIFLYVCPSVWAWKKGRIKTMEKVLDHLCCLFPFEPNCFTQTSLETSYFGHPLVQKIANYSYEELKFDKDQKILSIFPGSRKKEVERNLPLMLEMAREHGKDEHQIKISYANETLKNQIKPLLKKEEELISSKNNYELMKASSFAFAVSGTITLELAMHGVPSIVCYAIKPFDFFLARKIFRIDLPHYCIANYTAKERVYPEFYGPHFNKNMISETLSFMMGNNEELSLCKSRLHTLKKSLEKRDPSGSFASMILQKISQPPPLG